MDTITDEQWVVVVANAAVTWPEHQDWTRSEDEAFSPFEAISLPAGPSMCEVL